MPARPRLRTASGAPECSKEVAAHAARVASLIPSLARQLSNSPSRLLPKSRGSSSLILHLTPLGSHQAPYASHHSRAWSRSFPRFMSASICFASTSVCGFAEVCRDLPCRGLAEASPRSRADNGRFPSIWANSGLCALTHRSCQVFPGPLVKPKLLVLPRDTCARAFPCGNSAGS